MALDPQTLFLVQALIVTAKEMYALALARSHVVPYGPDDRSLLRWMTDVRPGDLVLENSSLGLHPERIGRMLCVEDGVYTVVGIEGEVMRWENSDFIRIPDPFGYPRNDQDKPNWRWNSKHRPDPSWKRDK